MSPEANTLTDDGTIASLRAQLEEANAKLARVQTVVAPHAEAAATVRWETSCPEDSLFGSYDDMWSDGQDNGQAFLAAAVLNALAGETS